jgi:hypothetical protein
MIFGLGVQSFKFSVHVLQQSNHASALAHSGCFAFFETVMGKTALYHYCEQLYQSSFLFCCRLLFSFNMIRELMPSKIIPVEPEFT